jgi:hypothetical protein
VVTVEESDVGEPASGPAWPRPGWWGTPPDDAPTFSVGPLDQPLPPFVSAPSSPLAHAVAVPAGPGSAPRRSSKRRWGLVVSVVALVMIAAAAGGLLATSGRSSPPGSGTSPADFVVASTQNTVAQRTADMDITGSVVDVRGATIPISGDGQVDFTTNQFAASVDFQAAAGSVTEKELTSGSQAYMNISVDGQSMSVLTGGAQWVSIPFPQQSAGSIGGTDVDPLRAITLMEQRGADVESLGPSTIDGEAVSGYSVTPSEAEIQSSLQHEVRAGQLPASALSDISGEAKALGTLKFDIWIDGNDLLRRESVDVGGGSSGTTADISMTFQDFGTPVSIEAPAPGSVVSLGQALNDIRNQEAEQTTS